MATMDELTKRVEALEKENKELKESKRTDAKKDSEGALKTEMERLKVELSMADAINDQAKARKLLNQMQKIYNDFSEEALQTQTEFINKLKESGDSQQQQTAKRLEDMRKIGEMMGKDSEQQRDYLAAFEAAVSAHIRTLGNLSDAELERLESNKKKTDEYGRSLDAMEAQASSAFGSIARNMKISEVNSTTFLGKLRTISDLAKSPEGVMALQSGFLKAFSSINIAASALSGIVSILKDFVTSVDEAASALAAFSGTGIRNAAMLGELKEANQAYGLSADDFGKANQALIAGFGQFSLMNRSTQKSMVETVAQLQKLGVSGDDTTKIMQSLTKGMGLSNEKAIKQTKALQGLAKQLGTSASVMSKDFAGALPTIMVYGDKTNKVFKGLAAQAAATGTEMSKLVDIAKQFDTFEGSALAVGKLNQILGSNLDSNNMLMMSEEQRIETIIRTVQARGIEFKDMGKFQKLAIANAAGITDMSVAMNLFGMNVGQYKKHVRESKALEDQQAKLNEAMAATNTIMVQLKMAFMQLAISLTPYLEDLRVGVTMLAKFIKENKDMIRTILKVGGAVAAFRVLAFTMNAMTFGIIPKLITGLFTTGTAMKGAAAGGGAAAAGLGSAMKGLAVAASASMQSVAAGIVGFVKTLGAVGKSAGAALKPLFILAGFTVILLGAAFAAKKFADAISVATDAGIRLFNLLMDAGVTGTLSVIKSMAMLQSQLETFAKASPVIAAGFGAMAIAIGGFALALRLIPLERLEALVELSKGFASMKSAEVNASFKAASSFVSTLDDKRENIKPLLENMAIITGGKGAETGALGVLTSAINNVGKKVEEAGASAQKAVNIKIDSDAVRKLFMEGAYSAFAGTGVLG